MYNGGENTSIIFAINRLKKQFSNYVNTFGNTIFAAGKTY